MRFTGSGSAQDQQLRAKRPTLLEVASRLPLGMRSAGNSALEFGPPASERERPKSPHAVTEVHSVSTRKKLMPKIVGFLGSDERILGTMTHQVT